MLRVRVKTRAVWEMLLRRNMTQNDLAKQAKLSSGHLSQLINGERFPSPAVRRKLMEALDQVDFDDIFEIEEVPGGTGNGLQQAGPGDAGERAEDPGAAYRTGIPQR